MAADHQIDRAFQDLGALFAAEHSEHDDIGARHVGRLIRGLRKFKAREQSERERRRQLIMSSPVMREATYGEPATGQVWYDNGDAIRDVSDLYTVLSELHSTGSPNLENMQARGLLEHLQRGGKLGDTQIAVLRGLLGKHHAAIGRLRRSRDRDGQDILNVPDVGAQARIVKGAV